MENLSFDSLPAEMQKQNAEIQKLTTVVDELKKVLTEKNPNHQPTNQPEAAEQFLSITEAAAFLHLKKGTLYRKVSQRKIPVMKRGKILLFSKAELIKYMQDGRKLTTAEIKEEAAKLSK